MVQLSDPLVDLYVPVEHDVHLPAGPVYPALHLHSSKADAPDSDQELLGHVLHVVLRSAAIAADHWPLKQSVHVADPMMGLYLPGTQLKQAPF
jgi:hypothetical protein